jgi:flagellar hook-associated protein FlgK
MSATFMPYSLNGLMSNYIVGKDDVIDVDYKNKDDRSVWFFSKHFPDNFSLTNASAISFTMTSFMGDFTNLNNPNSSSYAFVKLFNNVTKEYIVYPVSNLIEKYDGEIKDFYIPMVHQAWIDGVNYMPKTHDEFKYFLKNISLISILGDWTRGNETIGLDNVKIE